MANSNEFGSKDLDNALESLRAQESKGIVFAGNTDCVTAVKLVDNEAESVLGLHCLDCESIDYFTKSAGREEWSRTPFVNEGCSEFIKRKGSATPSCDLIPEEQLEQAAVSLPRYTQDSGMPLPYELKTGRAGDILRLAGRALAVDPHD